MLGDDLTGEVLWAVNTCSIPDGWNDTAIVMVPKVNSPEKITQFRPTSLCNAVYKVISKMIATRLKIILSDTISPTQSACVPAIMITHNILVAYECLHKIKKKRTGKEGLCATKLDMHKAYDRVEWPLLKSIMLRLGFQQEWANLIM